MRGRGEEKRPSRSSLQARGCLPFKALKCYTWRNNLSKGYTLIELTVVISLLGLIAALAIPRFQDAVLTDDLKSTARRMVGMIRDLRNEAVRTHKDHYLYLDLESNRFWTENTAMTDEERELVRKRASSLPRGVRIMDIWLRGEGKRSAGAPYIPFSRKGYTPQSAIHIGSKDGRRFTLVLSPFLQKVKMINDYIDFEDT
jgi:prepilin-type N-terminal cleavage/methylation domain-containing protein